MKLFIHYNDKKDEIIIDEFKSINSIIAQYLNDELINIDNYYLDYNGMHLDKNNCLEKYNITEYSTLHLNKEIKGGGMIFTLFTKGSGVMRLLYILYAVHAVQMGFIHSSAYGLLMAFIPLLSLLIYNIMDMSFQEIGYQLVCKHEKIILYRRLKFLLIIIKYTIFILMLYVVIAVPITIFCVGMKGSSLYFDPPDDLCSSGGLKLAKTVTIIYLGLFLMYYMWFRFGNKVVPMIMKFCKKHYILELVIGTIILKPILWVYNKFKYLPAYILAIIPGYSMLIGLSKSVGIFYSILKKILEIIQTLGCSGKLKIPNFGLGSVGCPCKINVKLLSKIIMEKIQSGEILKEEDKDTIGQEGEKTEDQIKKELEEQEKEDELSDKILSPKIPSIKIPSLKMKSSDPNKTKSQSTDTMSDDNEENNFFSIDHPICMKGKSSSGCCNDENYARLGDTFLNLLSSPISSRFLEESELFTAIGLVAEIFYEKVKISAEETGYIDPEKSADLLLRKHNEIFKDIIVEQKAMDAMDEIKKIIEPGSTINEGILVSLLAKLKITDLRTDKNYTVASDGLKKIDELMKKYSSEFKKQYMSGNSPIKSIIKMIFFNVFCNIVETSGSGLKLISKVGSISELSDVTSAGIFSGGILSIIMMIGNIIIFIVCLFGISL
jgi:hypothetical protein